MVKQIVEKLLSAELLSTRGVPEEVYYILVDLSDALKIHEIQDAEGKWVHFPECVNATDGYFYMR